MLLFKTALDYLVYLNLIIATSAFALSAGVANVLSIDNYLEYGLFGFLATFCVYNSQRLFKLDKSSESPRIKWVCNHLKLVYTLSLISLLLSAFFYFKLHNGFSIGIVALLGMAAIVSCLYVVRIGKKNLRETSYLKTHSIALTWTLVIIAFPAFNEGLLDTKFLLLFVPAHYLYFLAVAVSFDIHDLKVDPSSQRTIPQIVGSKHTKKVAITLLTLSAIGITWCLMNPFALAAILIQLVLVGLITKERNAIYFDVFIDGAISLLGFSYLVP